MSIGVFLGFRSAFSADSQDPGLELSAVDRAMKAAGLRPYREDPDPGRVRARYETLHRHARSALDHSGSGSLRALGSLGEQILGEQAGPLADLAACVEIRLVPATFPSGLPAPELPGGRLWSTGAMLDALLRLAPGLGIPLENGTIDDATLEAINDTRPFGEADTCRLPEGVTAGDWNMVEDHRPNWLLLYEFTRVAHEFQTAVVLAG